MDSDFCTVCYKPVKDSHSLYCGSECASIDSSSQLNSNTPPPSPPAHLRFSISLMPNTYYASEANSNKVLSPPSSVSSSYSDSDVSSFTS
ncbi:3523_t:CDS:1, partial [Acaulospora morrowiae]